MIMTTVRTFRQRRKSWRDSALHADETHVEAYKRTTWWLLGVIPLYVRDELVGNTL